MSKTSQKLAPNIALREVDSAEIISLMDNSVDFLLTNEKEEVKQVRKWVTERRGAKWVAEHFRSPIAEHGFSLLIRVFFGGKTHNVLYDTGSSPEGVITNANRMGLDLSEIESVVLSHGHYDHSGGLLATLKAIDKENLPIIVHEDMFKTRGTAEPDGTVRKLPEFPRVRKEQMKKHAWVVVQFCPVAKEQTRVRLTHLGWREGEEWEKVFQYFLRAWDIVLGRLEHTFSTGKLIDWDNPYYFPKDRTYSI
jgi:metal-dependent hydrolase (beta-lactamase superfamily II)